MNRLLTNYVKERTKTAKEGGYRTCIIYTDDSESLTDTLSDLGLQYSLYHNGAYIVYIP